MKKIILDSINTKHTGRTFMKDDTLKLIMSASGCEFTFTGKKLTLSFGCDKDALRDNRPANFPRIGVLVDGVYKVKKVISSELESFCVIDSDTPRTADIKIVKLSEAAFSVAEVYPIEIGDEDIIAPAKEKKLKIEFIGDSITCGYGVDDSNLESEFSSCAENAAKSYAYLTASLLDADYSMFSASGYGIISGYTPDGTRNTAEKIPPYYESFGFSYSAVDGCTKPQQIKWDFSRFVPDIVVINLGTNDNSFCLDFDERKKEFEDAYLEFLHTVRKCNPHSKILCLLGIMGPQLFPYVENAVKRFCEKTGDSSVSALELIEQDGTLGYSSKLHPSEDTHRLEADFLSRYIKNNLL